MFEKAKEAGVTLDNKKNVPGYKLFDYYEDRYINENHGTTLPGERGEIMPNDPMYKKPMTLEGIKQ